MVRRIGWVVGVTLAIVACGAPGRPIAGQDGRLYYRIECRHRVDCPQMAKERCPDGYKKMEDTEQGAYDSSGAPTSRVREQRMILIRCVGPEDSHATR